MKRQKPLIKWRWILVALLVFVVIRESYEAFQRAQLQKMPKDSVVIPALISEIEPPSRPGVDGIWIMGPPVKTLYFEINPFQAGSRTLDWNALPPNTRVKINCYVDESGSLLINSYEIEGHPQAGNPPDPTALRFLTGSCTTLTGSMRMNLKSKNCKTISDIKSRFGMRLKYGLMKTLIVLFFNIGAAGSGATAEKEVYLSEQLSDALSCFDKGDYNTAILKLSEHGKKYAAESGIAYYFVAESHYNLALDPKTAKADCIQHLQTAIQFFNAAIENGLEQSYPEKTEAVVYKRAWSNFRLSAYDCNPEERLLSAYNDFAFIAGGQVENNYTCESAYMAAESLIRKSLYLRIMLSRSINEGEQVSIAREIRQDLKTARNHLEDVKSSLVAGQRLKACAQFQLQNLKIILAETYAGIPSAVYSKLHDNEYGETGREAALAILESVQYTSMLKDFNQAMAIQFQPLIQYNNASISLFNYLLTGENVYEVNVALDSIPKDQFRSDYLFFQGNRDQKTDIDEQRFIQLSKTDESYYNEVSPIYAEASYWLGWVQKIKGVSDSEINFRKYISAAEAHCDLRVNFLKEDAQMQLFYLTFDKNAIIPGQLKSLKQALINFQPTVSGIKKERDFLLSLVRVGLEEQAGSIFSNVDEVVELIRYMLPKAALVYGKERAQYLKYLDSLLKITQYQKSEQAKFYQGIVTFLRAEIQPEDKDVLQYYLQAAEIMKGLQTTNSKYKYEAQYITARAYFDAAKHEPELDEKEKLYRDAKQIFIQLVREQQSVRSLFYLSEILIHENNHLAASECYQAVINATCRQVGGVFWCMSAHAGLRNARNRGDVSEIQNLPIRQVKFPENLNKTDDEEITLEQFGYQKYVRKNLWAESINRLVQFGLPRRQLFPAQVRGREYQYDQRSFGEQTAGIDERLLSLKSGLILQVVLPADLTASEQNVQVFYNGRLIGKGLFGYQVESIPLNEKAVLEIKNGQCYAYQKTLRFNQPRQMKIMIPLIQKFKFRRIDHTPDIEKNLIIFPNRLDKNAVFGPADHFSESSELYSRFNRSLYLRDLTYAGERILVVKDSSDFLMQFQLDGSMPSESWDQLFPLDMTQSSLSLDTPEGIAVDSSGNIYITDIDQNQLLIFEPNGSFRAVLGNTSESEGDTLKEPLLNRPKRVALSEDTEGIMIGEERIYRPTLIFITDRKGIHVFNSEGDLLETIQNTENQPDVFFDLMVTGYGKNSQIFVWNRKKAQIEWFMAESQNN
jgi:hypothetical protein